MSQHCSGAGNEIFQATCNALGGYLVQIESRAEQEFVWNIKKSSEISQPKLTLNLFFRIRGPAVDGSHGLWSVRLLDVV